MNTTSNFTESSSSHFATVDGIRIHYNDVGEGLPLLCIHGGGPGASAWSNFKQNIPAITQAGYRMIMVDMPGYGKSEFNDALIEDFFDYMGRMLDQFLSAIGIDEAVDLIGNSLGGQAALGLELHNPKRIKHLVLIGSQPTSAGIVIQPQPQEALNNIINYYAGEGPSLEKMRRLVESLLYDASLVTEETLNERFEASRDPGQMRLLGLPRRDLYSDLNEIAVATLLVWGHEDKGGALEVGLQMMKLMQNARMHIFQRCGHWAQVEHQEEFEQLVLNFLKS
ncbi:MAG: alpha/beta fold hydrolase [Gammaproteobacteria bacterium]|jgi:pimeloyl-ACP methyl ester carboxylesterase|nr:alpha/beta fold hydrolase [Gammaproteobacteria bacterium]